MTTDLAFLEPVSGYGDPATVTAPTPVAVPRNPFVPVERDLVRGENHPDDLLDISDVCALLRVHRDTLLGWRQGQARRFPEPDVEIMRSVAWRRSVVLAWARSEGLH